MKKVSAIPSKGKFSEKRAKRCGKRWREYVVHDWALIYQAHACHIANTAKALDLGRNTLLRYLKEDNEIKAAFNDVRLTEYDDVRLELVKLALDGHFHAIRYYLELRGTFADSDGGSGEGEDSEDEKEGTQIFESMTTLEKAEAWERILEEDNERIDAAMKRKSK